MSSTKNIAKNSLFLYSRMFINMLVGLFTAGIVLNTLGITDYGIYNVVGGFVSMFAFLNSSMSAATQRFLSFDMGTGNKEQLRKTFSTAVTIHLIIAIIIVILLETVGLWYINNRLNVPTERLNVVNIVFQFSVLTSFFGFIQVPYNSLMNAYEKFNIYAYISLVEIAFKLIILFLIVHIEYDKLILYSAFLFISSILIRSIYRIYCIRNIPESRYKFSMDKAYFKVLLSYSGWNLFTNIAFMTKNQGINVLLNFFFGTTINAAYGITTQIQGLILNFVSSFQNAVNPQIVKSYAADDVERSNKLMQQSAKFSFGLVLIMVFPVFVFLKEILDVWLKLYPEKAIVFIKIVLINILLDSISNPLMMIVHAKGEIRKYQIVIGIIIFLNFPISYVFLKQGFPPEIVFVISVCITLLILCFRIYFLKSILKFNLLPFFKNVVLRIMVVMVIITLVYVSANYFFVLRSYNNPLLVLLHLSIAAVIPVILSYFFIFSKQEKLFIKSLLIKKSK